MWSLPPPVLHHEVVQHGGKSGPGKGAVGGAAIQPPMTPPMCAAQPLSSKLTEIMSWHVGVAEYDEYLAQQNCAPDVYAKLAEIPLPQRLKLARSTFQTQPSHPQSWLLRCIEKHWEQKGKGRGGPYNAGKSRSSSASPSAMYNSPGVHAQGLSSPNAFASPPSAVSEKDPVWASPGHGTTTEANVRRSLWSPGPANQTPPEWATEMHKNMKDKSKVMELFFSNVEGDKIAQLSKLSLPMQLHIAVSCMLNPSAWQSVNEYVVRCMATLERLENPGAAAPSSSGQPKTIQLVVITVGYGMGLGHMAVHAALQHVSRGVSSAMLQLVGAYSFETDMAAVEVEKTIASRLHWTLHVCGDASGLVPFVKNNASAWKGCKVLLMSRLPRGKALTEGGVGHAHTQLHQTGIRLVWPILQVLQYLGAEDKSNVLHLADIPVQTNRDDEAWLDKVFGVAFQPPLDYYNGTARVHHLRTNYTLRGVAVKHLYNRVDVCQTVDGWQWTPRNVTGDAARPAAMTSAPSFAVCKAASEALYDDAGLSAEMKDALATQTMTHVATQERRLMSVSMWMHMLSLKESIAEKVLKETHPCHGVMLQVNGNPPPAGMPDAPACGTGRWCKQCEESLRVLGKCPHVPLMTDILVGLLTAAGEAWANQDVRNFKDVATDPAHECGPSCAYVTQRP